MYETIHNWLCCAAQQSHIQATFQFQRANPNGRYLHLPVDIEREDLDAGEVADLLQTWEDSWNDQKPEPQIMLTLEPSHYA